MMGDEQALISHRGLHRPPCLGSIVMRIARIPHSLNDGLPGTRYMLQVGKQSRYIVTVVACYGVGK